MKGSFINCIMNALMRKCNFSIYNHCQCRQMHTFISAAPLRNARSSTKYDYQYLQCKVVSKCPEMYLNVNYNWKQSFHSSCRLLEWSNIPFYFHNVASEIPILSYNEEDDLIDLTFTMEDDIENYFLSRAITYQELDTSFITSCPSSIDTSENCHDVFIDKNSGYFVCPSCCTEGPWENLVKSFSEMECKLTQAKLTEILSKSEIINESDDQLCDSLPFKICLTKLNLMGARIAENRVQILFPLNGEDNEPVGVASLSLLLSAPKVVYRLMEGQSAFYSSIPLTKKTQKKVVVVSSVLDSIKLAKGNIPSIVMVREPTSKLVASGFQNLKNVVFWLDEKKVPASILKYLSANNIQGYFVVSNKDQTISSLSNKNIQQMVAGASPMTEDAILMYSDFQDEVYNRVINKDTIYGTQWTRFKELNHFLLGHREGELTVLSGSTGCGKTTFMSEYSLDLCMQGVPTLWGSFEINIARLCEVMLQQFSGAPLSEVYSEFKILSSKVSDLPLFFINIHGQQPINEVIKSMSQAVCLHGIKHVIIDNLQFMLGLNGANADWWLEQDRAVGVFRQFATANNCHVTLIVHPRKLSSGEKLNMNSISGGARVTQEADNVMLLQVQENSDGSKNLMGPKTLQIVKNRYGGTLGEMKMRFHKDSLTLSSCFSNKKLKEAPMSFKEALNHAHQVRGLPNQEVVS